MQTPEKQPLQVGGHSDTFQRRDGRLWKITNLEEIDYYRKIQDDPLAHVSPKFFDTITSEDGRTWMVIEDLLDGMADAVVMDIKMGTRTFDDDEPGLDEPRMDLLNKMVAVDPDAPTPSEREHGVTKRRYMTFRESLSSIHSLGFRIEGLQSTDRGQKSIPKAEAKHIHTTEMVSDALRLFVRGSADHARELASKLRDLREDLSRSQLFPYHIYVGSSLMLAYDASAAAPNLDMKVRMIDFAKTRAARDLQSHTVAGGDAATSAGDGYFYGLDQLLGLCESLSQ